jgi:very-long-chain enoyl-CoA reductase
VFYIEYAGPIFIILVLVSFSEIIYGKPYEYSFRQWLGLLLALSHYIKRELETVFVHRFSNDTMPLINVFKNSTGYWVMFGVLTMGSLLHPQQSTYYSPFKDTLCAVAFGICEYLNLMTHLVLKSLRKPGTTERGIPRDYGFNQVSCANYWWEFCSWVAFACLAEVWGAWIFTGLSFCQMFVWARKKHARYLREFK